MKKKEAALIRALEQVEDFLTANADALAGTVPSSAREKLSAMRAGLVEHMKVQAGSRRAALNQTKTKRQLRDTLVDDHLRPIALMARSELRLSTAPAAFTLPPRRAGYSDVIAAGYGIAEAVGQHREALVAGGLKEDFIEQLVAAADALRDAMSAGGLGVAVRIEATAMLRKHGARARRYLRAVDGLVRSVIKPDQMLYEQWVSVSRVASVAAAAAATEDAVPSSEQALSIEEKGETEAVRMDVAA